jgi:hypothetical protein
MTFMNALIRTFETRAQNVIGSRILQIVAGLVVVYRFLTEIRFANFLFEMDSTSLLSSPLVVYASLAGWLIGGLALLTGVFTRAATLVVFFSYVVLENVTVTHDGGDNILRIVLLYMLLFHGQLTKPSLIKPGVTTFLHNVGVKMTVFQIVVLYLVSGTLKLQGDVWHNGTALYYITNVEQFSTNVGWIRSIFVNPILTTLATYATLAYQIGFSFMLNNRYHLVWVALGIGFHLGIFVVMGLTTFSVVMIGLILFTVRDAEWKAIISIFEEHVIRRLQRRMMKTQKLGVPAS